MAYYVFLREASRRSLRLRPQLQASYRRSEGYKQPPAGRLAAPFRVQLRHCGPVFSGLLGALSVGCAQFSRFEPNRGARISVQGGSRAIVDSNIAELERSVEGRVIMVGNRTCAGMGRSK